MNDREWQTADNDRREEETGEKKDSFFQNEDGWWEEKAPAGDGSEQNAGSYQNGGQYQNAGQYQNSGQYQNAGQYQNGGQYQNAGQYQNGGQYQNAGQYQNDGQYQNNGQPQNENPGYFPHSPYQGAPLRPDGRVDGPEDPVKVSEWLLTMLVLAIPCVNLIMLFVWGFGGSEKRSKSNYCKASLIWMAICCGIFILFYIVVIAGIVAGMS